MEGRLVLIIFKVFRGLETFVLACSVVLTFGNNTSEPIMAVSIPITASNERTRDLFSVVVLLCISIAVRL